MANNEHVDVLAIGAHPDDIELSCGGTVAKLVKEGRKVALADCTTGELGTRGTAEIRLKEAEEAAKILGVFKRVNLYMQDGAITPTPEYVQKMISLLRLFSPKAVLMHPGFERHPDHEGAHKIVREAMFKSGLAKIQTLIKGKQQEKYRSRKMYCYMQSYPFVTKPDFYVDISDTHEIKMEAIKAYKSQVHIPGATDTGEPQTRLSRPEFLDEIEARARYFGSLIGVKYAEAFSSVEPVAFNSISALL